MTLTQQRIVQLREALESDSKPSTYKQLSSMVGIAVSHVARLVSGNIDLYRAIGENKDAHRRAKFQKLKTEIDAHIEKHGVSESYACISLGYESTLYSKIRKGLA